MKIVEVASSTTALSSPTEVAANLKLNAYNQHHLLRYHRAAIDGYVDMLCDASKKETNLASEEDGFTPTLLAAYNGQLEALRILVGRGGNPEKTSADGSCALHLAASRNHLNCVSFLVNFGVNMWSLDNELHTAKDVAAIEQRKEVLDYLDQMMAKQSALNTKQVQKLKEKAKLAAEKRLKLLRKAQLKAIKQVERDEKYFIKLSTNRQLLRAAHSISDIKLVGKSTPFDVSSFKDSINSTSALSCSSSSQGNQRFLQSLCKSSSAKTNQQPRPLTGASSIGNLSNLRQVQYHGNLLLSQNIIKKYPPIASSTRLSLSASNTNSDIESAYASSVSSHSDYVSSSCSGQSSIQPKRPKYSDLVALGQRRDDPSTNNNNNSSSNAAPNKIKLSAANNGQAADRKNSSSIQSSLSTDSSPAANEQSSLKSNSTIANKLRAIGGVSRKVQLKRMLLLSSSATNSTAATSSSIVQRESLKVNQVNEDEPKEPSATTNEPDKELKLNQGANKSTSVTSGAAANQASTGSMKSCIKWPPAPGTLSRANSEPEFGSLPVSADDQPEVADENNNDQQAGNLNRNKDQESCGNLVTTAQVHMSQGANGEYELQQHHLLTQCLSQLKMQHEAIYSNSQQDQQNGTAAAATPMTRPKPLNANPSDNSDELLQHQMSAGEFPLRPSLIKQQQQQFHNNNHHISQIKVSANRASGRGSNSDNNKENRSTTVLSVDSIGSASSFIQRCSPINQNSRPTGQQRKLFTLSSSSNSNSNSNTSSSAGSDNLKNSKLVASQAYNSDSGSFGSSVRVASNNNLAPPVTSASFINNNEATNMSQSNIDTFLQINGLSELSQIFATEQIDLEALMLLTEDDMKSLNILLGPRRKLMKAIELQRHQTDPNNIQHLQQRRLFCMVDTQL